MRGLVVGNGHMGKFHVKTLETLGVDVITVDPDPRAEADYPTIRDAPKADFACIATPVQSLALEAARAMQKGLHVLVEKPMALEYPMALQLLHIASEEKRLLAVGYCERGNPAVQALKANLDRVGQIHHVVGRRYCYVDRPKMHVVPDLASHEIDVLHYLGLNPRIIMAEGGHRGAGLWFNLSEGQAFVDVCNIAADHMNRHRRLQVHGNHGVAILDYIDQSLAILTDSGVEELNTRYTPPLINQWTAFLNGQPLATGDDGVRAWESFIVPEPSRLQGSNEWWLEPKYLPIPETDG